MRIRTVKPEFWLCEDLATKSDKARLLAIGLLNYADDEGYFNANPSLIKAAIFPLQPSVKIPVLLQELSDAGYVRLGSGSGSDGKSYGHVVTFKDHQVISHPKPSRIRDLCTFPDPSSKPPVTVHPEGKGKEQGRFTPPDAGEVTEYAKSIGFTLNGNEFVDYYQARGWRHNNGPMKDWKAAVRTWKTRDAKRNPPRRERKW